MHPVLEQIDPLSFTTVRLQTLYNDQHLSNATGFFYGGFFDGKPNIWLATNWHVLAGRHTSPPHNAMHSKGAIPNRVRLNLILKANQPEYTPGGPPVLLKEHFIDLYNQGGLAFWYQHAQGPVFDVAVLNLHPLIETCEMRGINHVALNNDMAIQIGNQIFILGYPLGFQHFAETPIWKAGVIASEPNQETHESRNRVVIDATTRQGMSGSPVIMRQKTHYISEQGDIVAEANATRFIGIYSSRPDIAVATDINDEDRRAEIGFFYKSGCVYDAIMRGIRGPRFGELP